MIVMMIYKILTHSWQSCKSVYFVLYFNVCTLKILPWINKFYLSIYLRNVAWRGQVLHLNGFYFGKRLDYKCRQTREHK